MRKRSFQGMAKQVLRTEARAILDLLPRLNRDFDRAVELIAACSGRIVVTGMGKPGIIGMKISATLASLGVPSLFLHPAEAVHGDLGRVTRDDIVIAISNSGQTEEITRLVPLIKKIGAVLIGFTGNLDSVLARHSDIVVNVGVNKEACPFNLAPTASTTVTLAMGDALALAVVDRRGFKIEEYAFYHPGGSLGKRLLQVKDLMRTGKANPVVAETAKVRDVLFRITESRAGSASVVDGQRRLVGIFTDGDLRRHLEDDPNILAREVGQIMTKNPASIHKHHLAAEAVKILKDKRIDELPVIDDLGRPVGLLDIQDLLKAGL
ncbi:MAG: KpsF/GutQ family sugar-phosphate isomerase [Candidatus Omnitrophica bacterium]|nr:KpsF/GutQ family sugar-phosphate isomerase [Candidatus Omnitrophota bacterium]